MMTSFPDWRDLNRRMWDAKVLSHLASPFYDLAGFRAGRLSLQAHEIADLGDVAGRNLVHLQCHIGLDTLSWARLGAKVTGVDFSAQSVQAASALAAELGLSAQFVACDVYDAPAVLKRTFDLVYTGVGALCWLPDMGRWARVVRALLRPRGELYLFEFHPLEWTLDVDATARATVAFDYFTPPEGYRQVGAVAYADAATLGTVTETVQWNHPLGEVVTALVRAGLRIDELRELDVSVLQRWIGMQPEPGGMFRMRNGLPSLPLMYVLRASLPAHESA